MPQTVWAEAQGSKSLMPKNDHCLAAKLFSPTGSQFPLLMLCVEETMNGYAFSSHLKFSPSEDDGWIPLGFDGYPAELHKHRDKMFADAFRKKATL